MSDILQQVKDAVVTRKRKEIQGLVTGAIEEGVDPKSIIEKYHPGTSGKRAEGKDKDYCGGRAGE